MDKLTNLPTNQSLAQELKKAYSDPVFCMEALELNKEFEAAQLEVLSREPGESDAGE